MLWVNLDRTQLAMDSGEPAREKVQAGRAKLSCALAGGGKRAAEAGNPSEIKGWCRQIAPFPSHGAVAGKWRHGWSRGSTTAGGPSTRSPRPGPCRRRGLDDMATADLLPGPSWRLGLELWASGTGSSVKRQASVGMRRETFGAGETRAGNVRLSVPTLRCTGAACFWRDSPMPAPSEGIGRALHHPPSDKALCRRP